RSNMARAMADTGTDFVQPAGAPPVGDGGPFVGPYRAAAADNTSTVVSCSPSSVAIGQASTCTATVTDTDSAQNNKNPTGPVGFTASYSSGSGTITVTGSPCTLTAVGGTNNKSSCSVTISGSAAGTIRVTGSYSSDQTSKFKDSSGTTNPAFTVTSQR